MTDTTTNAPTNDAPNTDAPSTDAPSTDAPSTDAPSTDAVTNNATSADAESTIVPSTIDEIEGWFFDLDRRLFDWTLERQRRLEQTGDLLELGAYLGKSAVLIGGHVRPEETFTVCDLFETPAGDGANDTEVKRSYPGLTRAAFERNYLAFHDDLPEIVQGATSTLAGRLEAGSVRFAHIDASHLYEHVVTDLEIVKDALAPDGIVVCDDYRSGHTPGVAAAVWEAVLEEGLNPVVLSPSKLYGTWGDAGAVQADLLEYLDGEPALWHERQRVAGKEFVRVVHRKDVAVDSEAERLRRLSVCLRAENERLEEELAERKRLLKALRGSTSFKVGRAITAPPRALRDLTVPAVRPSQD
ncbi:class I SAM-dependent methyltransferase [Actinomadura gamaensis]|uniref:Class I SAM-dependent methyltransferase n=1 Tax=Actinomadura gamaensis TaxID=1763541 RepID=A0ABV9U5Q0_9ACTN